MREPCLIQSNLKTTLRKIQVRQHLIICYLQLRTAKLLKLQDAYEAKNKEASDKKICMKLTKHKAAEKERALKVLHKRLEAGEKKKDEAKSEKAT
jgi:hypothetical protein